MSSAFKEVEGRLVLTADAARLQRDLKAAASAVGMFKTAVAGTFSGAVGGFAAVAALRDALQIIGDEWERIAAAAHRYNSGAMTAKMLADVATIKRDMAIGNAAGPAIADYERSRARLADYEAARPAGDQAVAGGYGLLKTQASMAWIAAKQTVAGTSGYDLIAPGLTLPMKYAREYTRVSRWEMGGDQSRNSDPTAWQVLVQYWRDSANAARAREREGGG